MSLTLDTFQLNPTTTLSGTNLELRIWYANGSSNFLDVNGNTVQTGNGSTGFYISRTCSIASNIITVATGAIFTTLDAQVATPQSIQTFARLFSNNAPKDWVFAGWVIPDEASYPGGVITFEQLTIWNEGNQIQNPPTTYWTQQQTVSYFNTLDPAPDATTLIKGIGTVSWPPVSATAPDFLGSNDPRVGSWYNIIASGASTGNTAAQNATAIGLAVAAANLTGGGVLVPVGTFLCNTLTISSPLICVPGGILHTPTGQTITITNAFAADTSQHFANATAGLGTVSFSGNRRVGQGYAEWWGAAADDSTASLPAINAALVSGLKVIRMLAGTYQISAAGITGASGIAWKGEGTGVTTIKLMAAPSVDAIFFQSKTYFHIRDITFDYNNQIPVGSVAALAFQACSDYDVSDCEIINMGKFGISINGGSEFRILRNRIKKNTAVATQNQAIVFSTSAGNLADGWVQDNLCINTAIDTSCNHVFFTNNRVKDFKFGAGITTEQDVNTFENVITHNIITGGVGTDANAYNCGGIENWGARSVVAQNLLIGNSGSGIDQGGAYSVADGNVSVNNGTTGGDGIVARYGDATYNSTHSIYVGNVAYDTAGAGGTQGYGYKTENSSVAYQFVGPNMFEGNKTGPLSLTTGVVVMSVMGPELIVVATAYNPPSLANTDPPATATVSVPGAALKDTVEVSFSLDLQGLILDGYVSSANTVTTTLFNRTSGTVDLGAGTLQVKVIKAPDAATM